MNDQVHNIDTQRNPDHPTAGLLLSSLLYSSYLSS